MGMKRLSGGCGFPVPPAPQPPCCAAPSVPLQNTRECTKFASKWVNAFPRPLSRGLNIEAQESGECSDAHQKILVNLQIRSESWTSGWRSLTLRFLFHEVEAALKARRLIGVISQYGDS